jgi:hypothetical protein
LPLRSPRLSFRAFRKALGIKPPLSLLIRADELIE